MHGTSGMAETTGPGAGCTLVGSAGGMSTGGTSPPGISPPSIPLRISLISPRIKKMFNGKILSQRQTLQPLRMVSTAMAAARRRVCQLTEKLDAEERKEERCDFEGDQPPPSLTVEQFLPNTGI